MDFYSTSAQIFVVLLLALTLQSGSSVNKNILNEKSLGGSTLRLHQSLVYLWATIGIVVCLIKLADIKWQLLDGGKVIVFIVFAIIMIYLLLLPKISSIEDKYARDSAIIASFIVLVVVPPTLLFRLVPYFYEKPLDNIFLLLALLLIAIITGFFLFRDKGSNFKQLVIHIAKINT